MKRAIALCCLLLFISCASARFVKPTRAGKVCKEDKDCPTRWNCNHGKCMKVGAAWCKTDKECPGGLLCNHGTCRPEKPSEHRCGKNKQCPSGMQCMNGFCKRPVVPKERKECKTDMNCDTREMCFRGKCRPCKTCEKDANCPRGMKCRCPNGKPFCQQGGLCKIDPSSKPTRPVDPKPLPINKMPMPVTPKKPLPPYKEPLPVTPPKPMPDTTKPVTPKPRPTPIKPKQATKKMQQKNRVARRRTARNAAK